MTLSEITAGRSARVLGLRSPLTERRRLVELGVRSGVVVQVVRRAPLGGPIAVRLGGWLVALRPENAAYIDVEEVAGE